MIQITLYRNKILILLTENEMKCYFVFMAKLVDLSNWVERMLHGDAPRTRSLMQIGRKAGYFRTGGRGRGAPEMTCGDAANAALMVLYGGPPTEFAEFMRDVDGKRLEMMVVHPNGPRGTSKNIYVGAETREADRKPQFPASVSDLPQSPSDALEQVLAFGDWPYFRDEYVLRWGSGGYQFKAAIHDDRDLDDKCLESEVDRFQCEFHFGWHSGQRVPQGVQSERMLDGESLVELWFLIRNLDRSAVEKEMFS